MSDVFNKYCEKALEAMNEESFKSGFERGYSKGFDMSHDIMLENFFAAATVTKVVYNGYKTIVEFEDGDHVIVTYNPDYGYAYDCEKAVMSAILKHVMGNSYINALRRFADISDPKCEAVVVNNSISDILKLSSGSRCNICDHMIDRDEDDDPEANASVLYTPDGKVRNLSEDEIFLQEFSDMPEDDVY